VEFDRRAIIDALTRELGLVDPLDMLLAMPAGGGSGPGPSSLRTKACAGCVLVARG
jgi:hypothetical protein